MQHTLKRWWLRASLLQRALLVSLVLHGALLTVRFVSPQDFDRLFADSALEVVLVNARVELDESKRAAQYARCQELISQNAGMLCFAIQDYLDACSTKLRGLTLSGRFDLADARIAEKGWFA